MVLANAHILNWSILFEVSDKGRAVLDDWDQLHQDHREKAGSNEMQPKLERCEYEDGGGHKQLKANDPKELAQSCVLRSFGLVIADK